VKCTCKYSDALTEEIAELREAVAPQAANVRDAMTAPTEKIFQFDIFILASQFEPCRESRPPAPATSHHCGSSRAPPFLEKT
jgi:hypothetical protein